MTLSWGRGKWEKNKMPHARDNAKKKISCKEEGKEKNYAEGRSNSDFYFLYKIYIYI